MVVVVVVLSNIIDIAVPWDAHIEEKEKEKGMLENYHDLRRENAQLWHVNVTVTHVVVGALGMVTKNLQRSLQQIEVTERTKFLQKVALCGTTRILQKALEA